MKLLTILFITVFIYSSNTLCSQTYNFDNYDFTDNDNEIPEEYSDRDEIALLVNRKIAYENNENGVDEYHLTHEKIYVNSDIAIEKNNRIYLGLKTDEKVLLNKNRVILKDGTIITLDEKDIHEESDPESNRTLQYYAVKGLDKGAVIEKLQITQRMPYLSGRIITFQKSIPIVKSILEITYPKHIIFKYKSYFGLPEATSIDSTDKGMKMLKVTANNIPLAHFDETQANPKARLQAFRFKLYENLATHSENFYNYNEFATNFYTNLTLEKTKKEKKALKKFWKNLKPNNDKTKAILDIENYIKQNITYNKLYNENETIEDILKSKQANLKDLIILYKSTFDHYEIKSEFVFTSNRFERIFDTEFETTDNLQEVLLFLPETNQYLDIMNEILRSPLYNYNLGNNNGILIAEKDFAGVTMAVAKPVFLELPSMYISKDSMNISIDFQKDIDRPYVKSRLQFGGYSGSNFQPLKDYFTPDKYREILEDIASNYSANVKMEKVSADNDGIEYVGKADFVLNLEFYANELIENTGNKTLFKIGEIIGKQSQIYQTEKRQYPVEMTYPHFYRRILTAKIPDGYKISNPEVLNMDFITTLNGNTTAIFKSNYSLDGNILKIDNTEFYKDVSLPIEKFEDYKNVINAAADFNKIVLILEKI